MSFISSGAIHHRNWNLLLDLNGSGGQIPSGGGGGSHTVTYTYTNPLGVVEITQNSNLPLFDPILGTLTGAVLTITGNSAADIQVNTDAYGAPQNGEATAFSNFKLNCLGILPLNAILSAFPGGVVFKITEDTGVVLMNQSTTYNFNGLTGTDSHVFDLASILTNLIGVGNMTIRCATVSGSTFTGGPIVSMPVLQQAGNNGSITYTYTIP